MNTRFRIEMSKARLQSRADQGPRPGPQNDAETTRCSSMAQQPLWKNDVKCHVFGGPYHRKKCYFDEFGEGGSEFSNFWGRLGAPRGIQASMALAWTYPIELASWSFTREEDASEISRPCRP